MDGVLVCALWQGRDANRKLQRAIKAGKARERMPALVQSMHDLLDGWMEEQGCPFLYDGRDYKASIRRSPSSWNIPDWDWPIP